MSVDLEKLREKVLKTQVRVIANKAGGSGTVIYSKKNAQGTYSTYVQTCHHVIDGAINVKRIWDSKLGRHVKKEFRQSVKVEFFDYDNIPHGHRPVNTSVDADIVAYDQPHDMALLKMRTVKPATHVATLCTRAEEKKLNIGEKVWACGCALLHDPILTHGEITHMGDEIDYKDYWMSNASIIFGNSGGAVYTEIGFKFLGIPSRVDIAGWGSPITHLGYFSPIHRVYEFLDEQVFNFIYDPKHTEEGDEEERGKQKEDEEDKQNRKMPEGDDDDDDEDFDDDEDDASHGPD